jgi:hypothetical protein
MFFTVSFFYPEEHEGHEVFLLDEVLLKYKLPPDCCIDREGVFFEGRGLFAVNGNGVTLKKR